MERERDWGLEVGEVGGRTGRGVEGVYKLWGWGEGAKKEEGEEEEKRVGEGAREFPIGDGIGAEETFCNHSISPPPLTPPLSSSSNFLFLSSTSNRAISLLSSCSLRANSREEGVF